MRRRRDDVVGPDTTPVDQAIQWMIELGPEGISSEKPRAFKAWLAESPENERAWMTLQRGLSACQVAARRPAAKFALDNRLQHLTTRRTAMKLATLGAAAAFGGMLVTERFFPLDQAFASSATATGQRKRFTLADGSSVLLGPRSAFDLGGPGRSRFLHLRTGRMIAEVAPGKEPFIVDAAGFRMQIRTGRVLLARDTDLIAATTIEGESDLEIDGAGVQKLQSGRRALRAGGVVRTEAADLETDMAWSEGLLIAKNQTLDWIVGELRLYFLGAIRYRTDIARLRATGVFRLDNPRGALEALASSLNLEISSVGGYVLTLRRKEA